MNKTVQENQIWNLLLVAQRDNDEDGNQDESFNNHFDCHELNCRSNRKMHKARNLFLL
jgi:hypothetical protein